MAWKRNMLILTALPGIVQRTHNDAEGTRGRHVRGTSPIIAVAGSIALVLGLMMGTGKALAAPPACTGASNPTFGVQTCDVVSTTDQSTIFFAPSEGRTLALGGAADFTFDVSTFGLVFQGFDSLGKTGASTVTLSDSTSIADLDLWIDAGRLIAGTDQLGDLGRVRLAAPGILELAGNLDLGSIEGSGDIYLQSYDLAVGYNSITTTFSGSLSGTGGNLLKVGTGTLTLSGTNTNSGFVWASVGTIEVANGSAISDASRVLVNPGSTLRLLNNETIGSIEGVISGGGTVDLGTNNLTIGTNAYSTNWTGTIIGAGGSLTKVGLGDLTLSSANSYTGGTTVTDGVSAGPDGVLGTSDDTYGQLRIRESGTLGSGNLTIGPGGYVNFADSTSAGSAAIQSSSLLGFLGNSTAGSATIVLNDCNCFFYEGFVRDNASAGSASFNVGSAASLLFDGNATGGTSNLNIQAGGRIEFQGNATAAQSSITNSGILRFRDNTSVGTSSIVLNDAGILSIFYLTNGGMSINSLTVNGSAGQISLGSNQLTLGGSGANSTIGASIFGTGGGLTKTGAGTLTLSGNNTYTGTTLVQTGALEALGGTAIGDASAVSLASATTLSLGASETIGSLAGFGSVSLGSSTLTTGGNNTTTTFSGTLSGTGGLTKSGSGAFTLSGVNTFTGATTINAGSVSLLGGSALSDVTALTVASGASLSLSTSESIGSLAGAGSLSLAGNVLTSGGTNASTLFSGVISGTGGKLVKMGSGLLTLSGNNTFTGGIDLMQGGISLASNTAAGTGPITTFGSVIDYADGVTIASPIVINSSTTQFQVLSGSATQSGAISEVGGPRPFEKIGAGTLVLSGTNTFSGPTTISGGILSLLGGSALSNSSAVTVASDATLSLGSSETIGSLAGSGSVSLGSSTLTTGGNNTTTTFSGVVSGSGGLVKEGSGTFTLSGANTFVGPTNIEAGSLSLLGGLALSNTSAVTVAAGGTLSVGTSEIIGSLAGNGTVNLTASSILLSGYNNADTTFSGVISGTGGLHQGGSGTLTLSGVNTFTGDTSLDGRLVLVGGAALPDMTAVTVGAFGGSATLMLGASETIGSLTGFGFVDLGTSTLTTGVNNASTTFWGALTGTGGLTKAGSGTLTLSGANTFSGATTINAGSLTLLGGSALSDTSAVAVSSGATLALGTSETIGSLAGAGSVNLGLNVLTAGGNNSSTTFSGTMTGAGGWFTKTGSGTLTLSGTNTNTGFMSVQSGTLALQGGNAVANSANVFVGSGGTLSLLSSETVGSVSGSGAILLGGNVLTAGGNNSEWMTVSGTISGAGGKLVKTGIGFLELAGNNTFTGGIDLMQGSIRLASNSAAGTGPITTFGSVIDYADGVTIASPIVINSNTTQFQVLSGSATQSGAIGQIGGTRPFEKIGAGTLVLSGINTFSGPTTISSGTLAVSGGNALLDSANVLVSSGSSFRVQSSETIGALSGSGNLLLSSGAVLTMGGTNASWTFGGTSSGAGGLSKTGSGELSLTGNHGFTGSLSVNGGSLRVAPGGSFTGLGSLNIGSGAKLDLSSTALISTTSMSVAEGATLQAFLTPTAFPKITVSGVANLAGTFVANIDPAAFAAAGQSRYDFNGIVTGAVSGSFSSVVLNDPSGVYEAKPVYNSFDLVIQPSALPGNTLGMQATDTFSPSVSERTNTLRSPGCTVAGDTWCFRRYAQAEPTVATDAVSDIDPFAWAETGLRDAGSFSLWGRGVGAWSRMDGRGAAPDSRQETYGLIMGADRVIDSSLLIGFASQYTRTDSDFSGTLSGSSIEAVQAGVYMSLGDIDAHLDASASVIGSQARTRRHIDAGGVDQIARARFQAIALLLSAEVGTVFETEDLFRIEPLAGFSFAVQDTDDYRESNDGGAALIMSPEDLMSFRTSLGARISKVYDLGDRKLVPQFRLQWKHEALDVRPSFQAAFDTAPTTLFDLKGTSRARDALDFGLSGTMPVTGRITGYVDMSGLISEDTRTGAISVGARATW